MIIPSQEFRQVVAERRNFINYADVTLANGTVLHLEPKDFRIGGNTIVDSTSFGNSFSIGNAIGKSVTLRIDNSNDQYSQHDFYMARIVAYVALPLSETIEKIRKGTYTVTTPESTGSVIEITAVDDMYKLDKSYDLSALSYPATLQEILSDACLTCGVAIGFTQFDMYSQIISEKPTGVTYRQVVSYVAQVAGYNARINNSNALQLVWYDMSVLDGHRIDGGELAAQDSDTTIDGGDFTDYTGDIYDGGDFASLSRYHNLYAIKGLKIGTDDVVITGVKVSNGDTTATSGADGYVIEVKDNPFVKGIEQLVANHLGGKLIGMRFRPFSCSHLADPTIEAGDVAYLNDTKGNVYRTIITSTTFTTGSYAALACNAENPLKNSASYASKAAQAVVEARRNTEKQLTDYDKGMQNMNGVAANAMGFYESSTENIDGSKIGYMHDKPTREASTIIYKKSIDGFFLSQDGGESWTAGFDSNGNAVLNVLYAIGIVFDWCKGGTLTLGGSNNINGLLRVLNAVGSQVCRIDEQGIDVISGKVGDWSISGGNLEVGLGDKYAALLSKTQLSISRRVYSSEVGVDSWTQFETMLGLGDAYLHTAGIASAGFHVINNSMNQGTNGSYVRVQSGNIFRTDGNAYAQWGSGSDRRIKKNIKPIKKRLVRKIFGLLEPVQFNYNNKVNTDHDNVHFGLIAQKVKELFESLGIKNDIVEEMDNGYLYVNYHKLHGLEAAAIKDLYEIVDSQQKQINDQAKLIKKLTEKVGGV